ncbi:HAD family hydrolase [Pseudaestuariivita atlantica]|uniref:HAD family hydrolase n=1 Tax=Pseudaestuariivita atlantica TaxID=1317121 RepID=A0A0L1JQV0_9RHOB|nr:HAD family hydrolase [Pseudaestuariivita atlantica]KNG94116.1 HAD family hydrolase [Pseudaestuariivita atlantica]
MTKNVTTVGFDADDTLWHNEKFFQLTQARFAELLADHAEPGDLEARLVAAETRNLARYGFGIKGFVLSMIETALDVTGDRVPPAVIRSLIEAGHDMLEHPIELLPEAQAAVERMADTHRILLITKGDLLDQERKLAQSGLGDLFDGVAIVSDKTPDQYTGIFASQGDGADRGLMVGNSMKSDVLPMIVAGGWGVFVPQELAWDFEHADPPADRARYAELDDLSTLPDLVLRLG